MWNYSGRKNYATWQGGRRGQWPGGGGGGGVNVLCPLCKQAANRRQQCRQWQSLYAHSWNSWWGAGSMHRCTDVQWINFSTYLHTLNWMAAFHVPVPVPVPRPHFQTAPMTAPVARQSWRTKTATIMRSWRGPLLPLLATVFANERKLKADLACR